jgi:hypothetical protein
MPRHFGITNIEVPSVTNQQDWLQERRAMTDLLCQHLNHAQQHMKVFADHKRTERSFAMGDWAYLRVQPYIQTSMRQHGNAKLAFRYFGPYQVLAAGGSQAY